MQKCTAREAREALSEGMGGQLVDVREYSEYETERVAGSTFAPLSGWNSTSLRSTPTGPSISFAGPEDARCRLPSALRTLDIVTSA